MSDNGINPKDSQGLKKCPIRLVPPALLIEVAAVMKLGAEKYGPYNWREQSVLAGVYYEAALRHLMAWYDGEDHDPESGLSHVAHAAADLGILLDATALKCLNDDRPMPGPAAALIANQTGGMTCLT